MSLRLQLHLILATLIAGFTALLVVQQVEDTRRVRCAASSTFSEILRDATFWCSTEFALVDEIRLICVTTSEIS